MICSKCNSEIPDGAKFCTVCGAPCGTAQDVKPAEPPKEPETKNFCAKCGLEIAAGAKFCSACGAPAGNVRDIAPAPDNGQTFGNGDMGTVSLEKKADDLVSAMPAPAAEQPAAVTVGAVSAPADPVPAPANPVPAPTNSVPTPANSVPSYSVPTPTNSAPAPSFNSGYSDGSAMPSYSAPTAGAMGGMGAPMGAPMNGNGLAGAAAVAAPPKKKGKAGKVVLIIAIVLVVLIGGAAAFFFTNKATALSIIMGKPKYAAMVEKDTLKKATEKIDMEELTEQINTMSELMSSMGGEMTNVYSYYGMSYDSTSKPQFAPMMVSAPPYSSYDVGTMLKNISDAMQSTYGASSLSGSVTINADFDPSLVEPEVTEILGYINNQPITYDVAATENLLGTSFGMTFNGKPVDMKYIMLDTGDMYIQFPFVSDEAIMVKMPSADMNRSGGNDGSIGLDLDADELQRMLDDIINLYSDAIKESSTTMEKGSLIIAGKTIEGKKMVSDIHGAALENLCNSIIDYAANDSYLMGKLADYLTGMGEPITADDLKNSLLNEKITAGSLKDTDKLVVTSILTNNGEVLAKSYTFGEESGSSEIAYAINDTEVAAELKSDGRTLAEFTVTETDDKSGKVDMKVYTDLENGDFVTLTIDYSNAATEKFGNEEVPTGTYSVSIDMSQCSDVMDEVPYEGFNGKMTFKYTASASGSTAQQEVDIDAAGMFSLNVKMDLTISDDISKFVPPINVIDLTDAMTTGEMDEATQEKLMNYLTTFSTKVVDIAAGTPLEDMIEDYINGMTPEPEPAPQPSTPSNPSNPTNPTNPNEPNTEPDESLLDKLSALDDQVFDEYFEPYDWMDEVGLTTGAEYDAVCDYQDKLYDLDDRMIDSWLDGNVTAQMYEDYQKEFNALLAQKDAVKNAYYAAANKTPSAGTAADPTAGGVAA